MANESTVITDELALSVKFAVEQGQKFFPITHRKAIMGLSTNTLTLSKSLDIEVNATDNTITINPVVQTEINKINTSVYNLETTIKQEINKQIDNLWTKVNNINYALSETPGGAAISAVKLETARKITIGDSTKTFDGTANIAWTLDSIGAAASAHTHKYAGSNAVGGVADSAAKLATPVSIKIGNSSKIFDGSEGLTWTFSDIGAAAASHTHSYAGSSSAGGPATSANKLASAITLTIGATGKDFDGSAAVSWTLEEIGAAAASHGTHVKFTTTAPKEAGTANAGVATTVSRSDHVHPLQTSVSGNAGTATKLANSVGLKIGNSTKNFDGSEALSWTLSEIGAAASSHTHSYAGSSSAGGAATSANKLANSVALKIGNSSKNFNGSAGLIWTLSEIGAAAASHGTHVTYATTAPKANGTASAGSADNVSRGDHVHPLQTSVSGNAGTATKLATARNLTIGSTAKSFNGSADVSWSLSEIGAAAASTHNMQTYTDLAQLGLSDDSLSSTDFISNMATIAAAMPLRSMFFPRASSNFTASLRAQLNTDLGLTLTSASPYVLLTKYTSSNSPVKIELVIDSTSRSEIYTALFDATADGAIKYHPFVATYTEDGFLSATTKYAGSSSTGGAATSAVKLATARTLTIGSTGKDFDGSKAVSWTLSEIGAAAASHTHSYLPLSGGSLTSRLNISHKDFVVLSLTRTTDSNFAGISFNNNIANHGAITMRGGNLVKYKASETDPTKINTDNYYTILDTENYTSYAFRAKGGTVSGNVDVTGRYYQNGTVGKLTYTASEAPEATTMLWAW